MVVRGAGGRCVCVCGCKSVSFLAAGGKQNGGYMSNGRAKFVCLFVVMARRGRVDSGGRRTGQRGRAVSRDGHK